ncbi:MAG: UbiA family prenyltransferase [Rhodocyclaceae bacterium]|nr:UbiA family prenyltransferase [Rhodocyclaceae bacterium]
MKASHSTSAGATGRLRAWLELTRAPNVFTAVSNIVAAQFIVAQGLPEPVALLLLCCASACLYTGGIVLNDCFDYAEDLAERPSRPLPSGRISRPIAFAVGLLLLLAGWGLAAAVGSLPALLAAAVAAMVLCYDAWAKRTRLGPVAMAACRLGNWLLGLSSGGALATLWPLALPPFVYIASLTVLSRSETQGGDRRPVLVCAAGMLLCLLLLLAYHAIGLVHNALGLLLLGGGAVLVGLRLHRTWQDFVPANIQRSVKFLVLGVIPFDALIVFAAGPWWGALVVVALLLPGVLIARRIYVT